MAPQGQGFARGSPKLQGSLQSPHPIPSGRWRLHLDPSAAPGLGCTVSVAVGARWGRGASVWPKVSQGLCAPKSRGCYEWQGVWEVRTGAGHCVPGKTAAEASLLLSTQICRKPPHEVFTGPLPASVRHGCSKCPQQESSDTPAWGSVVGEVTQAALFQTNICGGLGTAPSSCSSAAASRQLESLFAMTQH